MMLRVRLDTLFRDEAGRLCYRPALADEQAAADERQHEPFSGLAYRLEDGIVSALLEITGGVLSGPSTDWLAIPDEGLRVDVALLEDLDDYGPLLFNGKPLTGAAYDFLPSGACVDEEVYVDGRPTGDSQRAWYESGVLREMVGNGEANAWFENGRLQMRAYGGAIRFNLILRDDGRLGGIYLADSKLFELDTVRHLSFSDEVLLIGTSVDAALVRALATATALPSVAQLRLIQTSAGPDVIETLVTLPALRTLWLSNNHALRPEDAERLQRLRPEISVRYETG